ncbi:HPr-rel-A system PqqD family peptide chaperone [Sphingomonas sp. HHU CXW]|uniref:HPr-rel-A system PqqD family peptide chaperone n=1 Tax=Sphingomonas hominis TaxID=2741495 RepID=A0ABX2JGM1_9SPHN|nr:HPr-rel-A system PqqD family peptide chaperone [Sphingomonas hominis]NTS65631.1 HPr-rel-A system PqqD family peptide chaperone [Sphingomonas hominis]
MSATRYRAPPADALLIRELDGLVALYHRPSGATHLLASPAPELLDLLAEGTMTRDELLARLVERYDVADAAGDLLDARLSELMLVGLVSTT